MKYRVGDIIVGKVTGITKYGVFMSFDGGYTGLIHISEISYSYVNDINMYFKVGDDVEVRVIEVDKKTSRLQLSMKDLRDIMVATRHSNIKETIHGFATLKKNLPIWIEKKSKTNKKNK